MSQNTPTQSANYLLIKGQVRDKTPDTIVHQIALQLDRSDEAKERIEKEGIVVRDMKGSVISHPAIKIEIDACKLIAELLTKYQKMTR